jgi:uncharacterized tellurite resistance protein B-like protein
MIDAIRRFFDSRLEAGNEPPGEDALALATAALLVEIMRADREADESERARIVEVLEATFSLPRSELEELTRLAEAEAEEAHDLYQFTRLVNERYGQPERIALVRNLWRVAFADGDLDRHEEHLVRRVADLLHVRHSDFIRAKQEARDG